MMPDNMTVYGTDGERPTACFTSSLPALAHILLLTNMDSLLLQMVTTP